MNFEFILYNLGDVGCIVTTTIAPRRYFVVPKRHSQLAHFNLQLVTTTFNLKMRKCHLILATVGISLLIIVTRNSCYESDGVKLIDLPSMSAAGGSLAADLQRKDDPSLIEALSQVEFGNALASKEEIPVSENQLSGCQLVPTVHLLRHPGCQPKAISSFACSGSCTSYVKTSTSNFWRRERSCSCCQQASSQEATFALDCPSLDPPYRKVKTRAPIECLCRSCTDFSREDIRPQELVEALAGELNNG